MAEYAIGPGQVGVPQGNPGTILNWRKQYRNIPAGSKLEQI